MMNLSYPYVGLLIFHVSLCNIHDDRDKINDGSVMVLVFIISKEKDVPGSIFYQNSIRM